MKVVHLTSVHDPRDPRIFEKQCRSLAEAGHDTVLVAPCRNSGFVEGVKLVCVPPPSSRARRWTMTLLQILQRAWAENADVYHFHDPELIPVALALRARGRPVVYDVHEDYETSILQKLHFPRFARSRLAHCLGAAERVLTRPFHIVIAERYYRDRFPRGIPILNYPVLDAWYSVGPIFDRVPCLLYSGSISEDRGALLYARLVRLLPEFEVHLVGRVSPEIEARIRKEAGPASNRVVVPFVGRYVPQQEIRSYCACRKWLGGIAIFPRTEHYMRKELTKFFEYMALGLPVIASDFPVWRQLLEDAGSGICVNPDDLGSACESLRDLLSSPTSGAHYSEAGRYAVQRRFSWTYQERDLLELYRQLQMTDGARGVPD